jgi:hypothetical protein
MIIYITQCRVVTRNWQHDRLTIEKLAAEYLDVCNRWVGNRPIGTGKQKNLL